MDPSHLQQHLQDLAGRQHFLRTLPPDSERYKLWLGDLVEVVNVAYGPDSPEMAAVRDALAGRPRVPAEASESERRMQYLARLAALADLIERCERTAGVSPGAADGDRGLRDGNG